MTNKNKGENLIFLISQPRSGSTMLQLILSQHPQIHTSSESWLMLNPIYALKQKGYKAEFNAEWSYLALTNFLDNFPDPIETYYEAIRKMMYYLYNECLSQTNKLYFLDKTPRYYLIIPEIMKIFPEAKIIILLRNPLSVLASILNWINNDWSKLKNYYIDLFEAPILLYNAVRALGKNTYVVKYENFVLYPEKEINKLLDYLKLDYKADILNYTKENIPDWKLGDQIGIKKYSKPESSNVDNWTKLNNTYQSNYLGKKYLDILGYDLINNLGYNYNEMFTKLNLKTDYSTIVELSCDKIFAEEQSSWNKIYLITIGILNRLEMLVNKVAK